MNQLIVKYLKGKCRKCAAALWNESSLVDITRKNSKLPFICAKIPRTSRIGNTYNGSGSGNGSGSVSGNGTVARDKSSKGKLLLEARTLHYIIIS